MEQAQQEQAQQEQAQQKRCLTACGGYPASGGTFTAFGGVFSTNHLCYLQTQSTSLLWLTFSKPFWTILAFHRAHCCPFRHFSLMAHFCPLCLLRLCLLLCLLLLCLLCLLLLCLLLLCLLLLCLAQDEHVQQAQSQQEQAQQEQAQ